MKTAKTTIATFLGLVLLSATSFAKDAKWEVSCGFSRATLQADGSVKYKKVKGSEKSEFIGLAGPSQLQAKITTTSGEDLVLNSTIFLTDSGGIRTVMVDGRLNINFSMSEKSISIGHSGTFSAHDMGDVYAHGVSITAGAALQDKYQAGCVVKN